MLHLPGQLGGLASSQHTLMLLTPCRSMPDITRLAPRQSLRQHSSMQPGHAATTDQNTP